MFSDHNGIKLKISKSMRSMKFHVIWKVINTLLNNVLGKDEATRTMWENIFKWNENSSHSPNLWHIANTVLRGEYIALIIYIRKVERLKITT